MAREFEYLGIIDPKINSDGSQVTKWLPSDGSIDSEFGLINCSDWCKRESKRLSNKILSFRFVVKEGKSKWDNKNYVAIFEYLKRSFKDV